ncbi:MAG: cytidine deaminase [Firmicutes bacterium HGW-Firmicutes-21]|nr:MAG: cytidine deaminase [Firmicutes bacterium HGW-Firmicutes-21]
MIKHELNEKDKELILTALKTEQENHDYGMHYRVVACALLCRDGKVYKGINIGKIHGSCAEFVAFGAAVADGQRNFDTVVAVHKEAVNNIVTPCGNCRQLMIEYCPDIMVIVNDEQGRAVKVRAKDLIPFAYEEIVIN